MTFIRSTQDPDNLTLAVVAEFDAGVDRVWQVWEDPRQLERWWGPPTWPATFVAHDLVAGGGAHYLMSGPEGEQIHGRWDVSVVDGPHRLEFDDGFANDDGSPTDPPNTMHCRVTIEAADGLTRMTMHTTFASAAQLEEMIAMGMEEGSREAVGQIDALLV